jgi:hypothetical protein
VPYGTGDVPNRTVACFFSHAGGFNAINPIFFWNSQESKEIIGSLIKGVHSFLKKHPGLKIKFSTGASDCPSVPSQLLEQGRSPANGKPHLPQAY